MKRRLLALALLAAVGIAMLAACAKQPSGTVAAPPRPAKTGARLWADNCGRCHDARPLASLSDAQWELVSHHMRLQANLTGAEQRAILEFLESAN